MSRAAASCPGGSAARVAQGGHAAPRRVLLIRHGESEANVSGRDIPDPLLSGDGRTQAKSWSGHIERLGVELVLTSPLRRAVETACWAFAGDAAPIEVCAPARELWWHEHQNRPGPLEALRGMLETLPRGGEVKGLQSLDAASGAASEDESVVQLRAILAARPEKTLAVVCHYLLINELCGCSAHNGEVLVCEPTRSGRFRVIERHLPPGGPRTLW
mmetsp:Transcript_36320/g.100093  ORF Transcript_36320/g.100093 Transcript_36320/m.100093 type:complete len:216 (+) Transcript_36320:95-742(+)